MPRKKKNQVNRAAGGVPSSTNFDSQNDSLRINTDFADKYDAAKRKEILSNLPAGALDDDNESSSDDEEEDEHAVLLTKKIDRLVHKTITALRTKDPSIYDKDTKFFEDDGDAEVHCMDSTAAAADDDDKARSASSESDAGEEYDSDDEPVAGWDAVAKAAEDDVPKRLTLKDYVRENLLKDGRLSDSDSDDGGDVRGGTGDYTGVGRNVRFQEDHSTSRHDKALNAPAKGLLEPHRSGGRDAEGSTSDGDGDGEGEHDDADDGDFFQKKEKSELDVLQEDKDFDRFLKKESNSKRNRAGDEMLLHAYLERETADEKERFLQDFVLNNGWLDKGAGAAPRAADYSIEIDKTTTDGSNVKKKKGKVDESDGVDDDAGTSESDFEDKVDDFEHKYNFRFEEPDGAKVVSHARDIDGSLRRPDDRRKRAREARKKRKDHEKLVKTEDIKHLKNMKRREIEARLLALGEAAGDGVDFRGIDLDADFDPDEFTKQMEARFGDDYYNVEDADMDVLQDDEDVVANDHFARREVEPDVANDVNSLVDAYYNLDYEDIVGGTPVRFNYKKVEAETFGMDREDILGMDDKELNRKASLKYLAPYRRKKPKVFSRPWSSHGRDEDGAAAAPEARNASRGGHNASSGSAKKRKRPRMREPGSRGDGAGGTGEGRGPPVELVAVDSPRRKRKKAKEEGAAAGDVPPGKIHHESLPDVRPRLSLSTDGHAADAAAHQPEDAVEASEPGPGRSQENATTTIAKKKKKHKRKDRHEKMASALPSSRRAAYGLT
jgi:protein KRI1